MDGELPGRADVTASLLAYGAGSRDAIAFARDVEYLGADVSSDAGADSVVVDLETLRGSLTEGIELLTDMFLSPRFDSDDIERERAQRLAGLRSAHSDPEWRADMEIRSTVLAGTPYASPAEGTPESVVAIGSEEVHQTHRRFLSSGIYLVATGDTTVTEVEREFDATLGALPFAERARDGVSTESAEHQPGVTLIDRPGSAHTALRLARPGVRRDHPDYLPLRVLSTILGDYFNSRLNSRLREDLGYTYGAWSAIEGKESAGLLSIGTSVRGDRVGETIRTIREEIDRLAEEPVSGEELEMVARYMAGRQAMAQETPEQIGQLVATIELYRLGPTWYRDAIEKTRSLTPEELQEVAARYYRSSSFSIVAAGEKARALDGLSESGNVRIVEE